MLNAAARFISPDDILVTSSSVTGEDLRLSPQARVIFPFCFEVKCQERLNIFAAVKQAETHCEGTPHLPAVVFTRNHEKVRCVVDFEFLVNLLVHYYELRHKNSALPQPD